MNKFIFLIVLSITLKGVAQAQTKNPVYDDSCWVTITRVIDGDTYEFYYDSQRYKIRLVGIDCFEIHRNNRLQKQADEAGIDIDKAYDLGWRALRFVRDKIENRKVLLFKDYTQNNFDVYGRLLRKVWVDGYYLADSLETFCAKVINRKRYFRK
jgi:endonuclease YncB( thermonuclease family)